MHLTIHTSFSLKLQAFKQFEQKSRSVYFFLFQTQSSVAFQIIYKEIDSEKHTATENEAAWL